MKIYLSGPMTGYEDLNYPAFHKAAKELRAAGYEVFNAAESFGGDQTLPYETYMREDIKAVLDCDVVVVLKGWRESRGANLEVSVARAIGTPVRRYSCEEGNVFLWDAEKEPI